MSYKIIADSCCEFPEEYKEDPRFVNIPLGLDVAGEHLWDDETFDQASFLQKVASSKTCPRSCCPSGEIYAGVRYRCREYLCFYPFIEIKRQL